MGPRATRRKLTTTYEAAAVLKKLGYVRLIIQPDGNCLFRSCADVCLGDQTRHAELRASCVAYLREHAERYAPFIETNGSFEEYASQLAKDATWGSDLELQIVSELFYTSFTVLSMLAPPLTVEPHDALRAARGEDPAYRAIWFSHGNHYDVLYTKAELQRRGLAPRDVTSAKKNLEMQAYLRQKKADEAADRKVAFHILTGGAAPESVAAAAPDAEEPAALSASQKKQPAIAHLIAAGFDEAQVAVAARQLRRSVIARPETRQSQKLDVEAKRFKTVQALLAAGFTERDLLEQLAVEDGATPSKGFALGSNPLVLGASAIAEGRGTEDEEQQRTLRGRGTERADGGPAEKPSFLSKVAQWCSGRDAKRPSGTAGPDESREC
ncbi:hypothetical protein T492DRAFT_1029726 [Pavlovales sp. CCMP2436]|nr:hypothetical protein T492DRAFT_1029726 [Pavlovales sp. CCMP2436]